MLWNAKIRNIINCIFEIVNHTITCIIKCFPYFVNNRCPIWSSTQHTDNILKNKESWLEVFQDTDITFKEIVSVIITHSMWISNSSCQRICLTRRTANYNIYLLVSNEFFKADVLSILLIVKTINQLVCTLNIESYDLFFRVLMMPPLFKAIGKGLTRKRFPFNACKCIESTFLHKTIHQPTTACK